MGIFNLYSKRQRQLRGEVEDVYKYDSIPQKLRVQIVHIIDDSIGWDEYGRKSIDAYHFLHNALCREYGVFHLMSNNEGDKENLLNFILKEKDPEKVLDGVELCFKYLDKIIREKLWDYKQSVNIKMEPDDSIKELNHRFIENAIGYQYENEQIIKIDTTYSHSEIVKPTLRLLSNKKFKGALEEYMNAHKHYRDKNYKECLTECLKTLESTLKIICKEKGWKYKEEDTAKRLIQICFDNNLVPSFTQNQFTSLRNIVESGVPTLRNKLGGHGQGSIPKKVDIVMARYSMNLTGTNIIFLIEQSKIK